MVRRGGGGGGGGAGMIDDADCCLIAVDEFVRLKPGNRVVAAGSTDVVQPALNSQTLRVTQIADAASCAGTPFFACGVAEQRAAVEREGARKPVCLRVLRLLAVAVVQADLKTSDRVPGPASIRGAAISPDLADHFDIKVRAGPGSQVGWAATICVGVHVAAGVADRAREVIEVAFKTHGPAGAVPEDSGAFQMPGPHSGTYAIARAIEIHDRDRHSCRDGARVVFVGREPAAAVRVVRAVPSGVENRVREIRGAVFVAAELEFVLAVLRRSCADLDNGGLAVRPLEGHRPGGGGAVPLNDELVVARVKE